jgi:tetratricopeptide (TPR) repeat protein
MQRYLRLRSDIRIGSKGRTRARVVWNGLREQPGRDWESVGNHWSGIIDWVSLSRNQTERRIDAGESELPRATSSSPNVCARPSFLTTTACSAGILHVTNAHRLCVRQLTGESSLGRMARCCAVGMGGSGSPMRRKRIQAGEVAVWIATLLFSPAQGFAARATQQAELSAGSPASAAPSQAQAPSPAKLGTPPASHSIVCPINPETAPPLSAPLGAAQKMYRTGKLDDAIAAYNAIVPAGGSEAAVAYAGLARVYLQQKKPADAYAAAMKAVALTPERAPAIVALGEVYFRQGKISEAETAFLKPLRACNLDARAFLGLNRIYRAMLNWKHAKDNIDQAYKLDPADPDIRRAYLATLNGAERIKALQEYLAGATDDDAEARERLENELTVLEGESDHPQNVCRLITKVTNTETRLERLLEDPQHIRGYALAVKVNGVSSRLMLDTGAGGILIDRKIAEKAGVKSIVDDKITGIGDKGGAAGYLGHADKIQIGELEFENCFVEVAAGRSVIGDDGLIGANVFSHFLVDLEMPDEKFKLSELPPIPDEPAGEISLDAHSAAPRNLHDRYVAPEMKDYTKIFLIGHALLIPTSVNSFPTKLFLIDTGSFDNTLSVAAAKEVTKISNSEMQVKGLSGNVKNVYRASKANIAFSRFKQDREDLVTFDLTHLSGSLGTEVSGILGFAMLRMLDMKIDYRDGLVNFTYDKNRFH